MDTASSTPEPSFAYTEKIKDGCTVQDLIDLGKTGYRASVVYADPPWKFKTRSQKGMGRSADRHYSTMTISEIAAMRPAIDAIAAKDSVLLMWATMPHLAQALALIELWGFTFKTVAFCWIKIGGDGRPITGMGFWTRANAEICLLATRGQPKRVSNDVAQIITAKRRGHSVKPSTTYGRIERLVAGPYLELFARKTAKGWVAWGNEIERSTFWRNAKAERGKQ